MSKGLSLLGRELMYVAQFMRGMMLFKYVWPCRKGYMQSQHEVQACAIDERIAQDISYKN